MKLLLTSAGITNKSILSAFEEILDAPFNQKKMIYVLTAAMIEDGSKDWTMDEMNSFYSLGFKEFDFIDVAAVPKNVVLKRFENADAIVFGGGVTYHLLHSLLTLDLIKPLKQLLKTRVYVGISAGSIIASKNIDLTHSKTFYDEVVGDIKYKHGLGLVDFQIVPHMNSQFFPKTSEENMIKELSDAKDTVYALDDNSAIVVKDSSVEVISEGIWRKLGNS